MSEVITVRIPRQIKEKLKKYNVNVAAAVRKALEDCINKIEEKELEERLELVKKASEKIDFGLMTKLIREDRKSH